ncbi:hypothetical protein S96127_1641 [Yersinia pestis]|nr:hypothetical protein S96127_1641 [Yersinia pestis]
MAITSNKMGSNGSEFLEEGDNDILWSLEEKSYA